MGEPPKATGYKKLTFRIHSYSAFYPIIYCTCIVLTGKSFTFEYITKTDIPGIYAMLTLWLPIFPGTGILINPVWTARPSGETDSAIRNV